MRPRPRSPTSMVRPVRAGSRLAPGDGRRRGAALYVEVRAMPVQDPLVALRHWRAGRERLYREHPQSPVPLDARDGFTARHFDYAPKLRFEVAVEPAPAPEPG